MNREEPNPASAKEKAEGSRENVNVDQRKQAGTKEFESKEDVHGKSDSGPEPEIHNRELPPQD